MPTTRQPNTWGSPTSSTDYKLMMAGSTPISRLEALVGHGITGESDELRDAVTQDYQVLEKGKIRTKRRTIKAAERIQRTGTLIFPNAGMTRLLYEAERNNTACVRDLFAVRLCPTPGEGHFYVYQDMRMNPPSSVNDFLPIDEATTADKQSEFTVDEAFRVWEVGATVASNQNTKFYGVAFLEEDCVDCSSSELNAVVVVGGDGTVGLIEAHVSFDRFATIKNQQDFGSAGSVGTSVYTVGRTILVGFADDDDPAAATSGGTYISSDLMESTPTVDSNLTEPVHAVSFFQGEYIAVGGVGGSQGKVWRSVDGVTWNVQTLTNLPADECLTSISVDDDNNAFYAGAEGGGIIKGVWNGSNVQFVSLTAPSSPTSINSIAVLDDDRFVAGGAASYGCESFSGGSSFVETPLPANVVIRALAGARYRTVVGAGTKLYVRDVLTDNQYEEVSFRNGESVTGKFTSINMANNEYIVACTDAGEVVLAKPYHPWA